MAVSIVLGILVLAMIVGLFVLSSAAGEASGKLFRTLALLLALVFIAWLTWMALVLFVVRPKLKQQQGAAARSGSIQCSVFSFQNCKTDGRRLTAPLNADS